MNFELAATDAGRSRVPQPEPAAMTAFRPPPFASSLEVKLWIMGDFELLIVAPLHCLFAESQSQSENPKP